jgi:molybdenum cofactor biosynthesis protein B
VVRFAVVTVSTSRYRRAKEGAPVTDESGDMAVKLLNEAGLLFCGRKLVPDGIEEIRSALLELIYEKSADLVVVVGGTGIAPSDVTIEALYEIFDKEIVGFRHLFFILSYPEVGTDVLTTRAAAGVVGKSVVFVLPGSLRAVSLAVKKIIIPQWRHLFHHLRGETP